MSARVLRLATQRHVLRSLGLLSPAPHSYHGLQAHHWHPPRTYSMRMSMEKMRIHPRCSHKHRPDPPPPPAPRLPCPRPGWLAGWQATWTLKPDGSASTSGRGGASSSEAKSQFRPPPEDYRRRVRRRARRGACRVRIVVHVPAALYAVCSTILDCCWLCASRQRMSVPTPAQRAHGIQEGPCTDAQYREGGARRPLPPSPSWGALGSRPKLAASNLLVALRLLLILAACPGLPTNLPHARLPAGCTPQRQVPIPQADIPQRLDVSGVMADG